MAKNKKNKAKNKQNANMEIGQEMKAKNKNNQNLEMAEDMKEVNNIKNKR